jgi:hypothetical protein
MDNVTDFLAYRESKKAVENLLATVDVNSLDHTELAKLVQSLGKLVEQQSSVLNALMLDMTLLVERHTEMQQQFIYVSGQAFLALQFLREKGICSPEEVETAWTQMIQEKILKPQGQTGSSPEEISSDLNSINESDSSDSHQM